MAYNELFSNNGIDTDDANATASQILSGYTAYVKGKKITGNIQSQDGQTITPMSSIQVIRTKDKYLTGDITVKGDSSLLAGNIRKGATIFGISGTYTSDANAGAGDILSGKSAYVNGSKITGNIANYGKLTNAVSSIFVEGGEAGTGLYVRIQRGAYLTNQSSGYPEVFLPYNKIDPYRGQWQNAGSIGGGGEYVALNKIPNGFYYSEGATSWAPEVRVNTDQLKNYVGAYSTGRSSEAFSGFMNGGTKTLVAEASSGSARNAVVNALSVSHSYWQVHSITVWGYNGSWVQLDRTEKNNGTSNNGSVLVWNKTYSGYTRIKVEVFLNQGGQNWQMDGLAACYFY